MKVKLCLAIALVMVAATLSCGLLNLPQACYEGDLPPGIPQEIQDFIAELVTCEEGKVCNSAISSPSPTIKKRAFGISFKI